MKKFLLLFCTVLLLGGCVEIEKQAFRDSYLMYLMEKQKGEPKTVSVTGVSLDKTTLSVEVSGHFLLTATVLPENASNKAVSWKSSNPAVALVDSEGNVSGISDGTAPSHWLEASTLTHSFWVVPSRHILGDVSWAVTIVASLRWSRLLTAALYRLPAGTKRTGASAAGFQPGRSGLTHQLPSCLEGSI